MLVHGCLKKKPIKNNVLEYEPKPACISEPALADAKLKP